MISDHNTISIEFLVTHLTTYFIQTVYIKIYLLQI